MTVSTYKRIVLTVAALAGYILYERAERRQAKATVQRACDAMGRNIRDAIRAIGAVDGR